mmetsp:Transcript_2015/g.4286  ORF Transcript_2015/g.4286 Transcript_2015/m.4286 type:complete len:251 (-) Transcript_2015:432-1184(-)
MNATRVKVARTGHVALTGEFGPGVGGEVAGEEVGFAFDSVVSPMNINISIILRPRRTTPHTGQIPPRLNRLPSIRTQIKFKHIIQPSTSIKPTKKHKLIIVHDAHVSKPATGPSRSLRSHPFQLSQCRTQFIAQIIAAVLYARPSLRFDVKHPQVVQPRRTVVAPEEVHAGGIADDDSVVFATARFFIGEDLDALPGVGREGEGVEIVETAGAPAISPKHVQFPLHDHARRATPPRRNHAPRRQRHATPR